MSRLPVHGMTGTPEYRAWNGMRNRCLAPQNKDYALYGGRGIGICDRWNDFQLFLRDMGLKPSPLHSIDRRDPNGHYCPENCHWGTPKDQAINRRNTSFVVTENGLLPIKEWSEVAGISYEAARSRARRGQIAIVRPFEGERPCP